VLHRLGLFWGNTPNFWTWLDIKELREPPPQPLGWIPERFWWWWRAAVISDYDLAGNFREVIDEFPFFSFLHADLHPHVLAIPFNLLAVAVALNLVLGGWRGEINLLGLRLQVRKAGFFAAALLLGGLAFLNTWDILIAAALITLAYLLFRVGEQGWSWSRLEDLFAFGLPLGLLAILLYLPFYFGFSSQAGGILPNLTNRGAAGGCLPRSCRYAYLPSGRGRAGKWAGPAHRGGTHHPALGTFGHRLAGLRERSRLRARLPRFTRHVGSGCLLPGWHGAPRRLHRRASDAARHPHPCLGFAAGSLHRAGCKRWRIGS
jgi:hypothetical protein